MLLFMEKLYDMHCHVGFAPAPATVAAEGAQAGIGALSCTVEPTEYEQLRAALADAPNVAVALGAHPWWIADGRVGETELARFCELARTTRFIGEIGSTSPARAIRKRAVPCRRALRLYSGHMQRVRSALGTHQSRRRDSNQRAKPNLYRNHEPRGEPTQRRHPHPQRHRHCAEAHLHPRHQCRRSSTRCARTSQHLCAASRDLSLVLRHFR